MPKTSSNGTEPSNQIWYPLGSLNYFESKLCLVATAEAKPLLNAVNSSAKESSGLLIVGPEGDFTKKEVEMMLEAGGTAVGLGPHRLRVETATIALLATLVMWSDSQEMI